MGSSCCKQQQKCPIHPDKQISHICIHSQCLEPLCETCVHVHRQKHVKFGCAPKIQSIHKLSKYIQANMQHHTKELQKNPTKEDIVGKPTAKILKQFTREYFARLQSKGQLNVMNLINELQLTTAMHKDIKTKLQLHNFLKNNLSSNKEVVGKDYSHLY